MLSRKCTIIPRISRQFLTLRTAATSSASAFHGHNNFVKITAQSNFTLNARMMNHFVQSMPYSSKIGEKKVRKSPKTDEENGEEKPHEEKADEAKSEENEEVAEKEDKEEQGSSPSTVVAEQQIRRGRDANLNVTFEHHNPTGQKFIRISKVESTSNKRVAKLPIGDAYQLISTIDALIKGFNEKLQVSKSVLNFQKDASICYERLVGPGVEIRLDLQRSKNGRLRFMVENRTKGTKRILLDTSVVGALREAIHKLLAEHDSTQPIQPMPMVPVELEEKEAGPAWGGTKWKANKQKEKAKKKN